MLLLYSLWILTVSAAFYVVKVDNLTWLFGAIFDAARWPSSVFRGAVRAVFTYVIPLALMTTFPAQGAAGHDPSRHSRGFGGRRCAVRIRRPPHVAAVDKEIHVRQFLRIED